MAERGASRATWRSGTSGALGWAAHRGAQDRDLVPREIAPSADGEAIETKRTKTYAPQSDHGMAKRFAVPLDLVLPTFREDEMKAAPLWRRLSKLHRQRFCRTVPERHAAPPRRDIAGSDFPRNLRIVETRQPVARMEEPVSERAVVGEQQQSLDVGIEAAHRIEACHGDEIAHGEPPLRIVPRRDIAAWLVEHHVALRRGRRDGTAVDGDDVPHRIRKSAELARQGAVDGDVTVEDQAVTPAA